MTGALAGRLTCVLALTLIGFGVHGSAENAADADLIHEATAVLTRAINARGNVISPAVMRRARAIAVFPAVARAGRMRSGAGVVGARAVEPEAWLPPAVVSFRALLRVPAPTKTTDVILIAISRRGFDYLARDEMTLPDEANIPPGPIGRDSGIDLQADIVAYARYGGTLAGVTLDQLEVVADRSANQRLYGSGANLRDLLYGAVRNSQTSGNEWSRALEAYFRELR